MNTQLDTPETIQTGITRSFQCRHLFTDGRRCASPALRDQPFCYYHHTTRHPAPRKPIHWCGQHSEFDLLIPEDRSAVQHNIGQVLQRIASNQIDPRRAGLLLYGLQIAAMNLPPHPKTTTNTTTNSSRRTTNTRRRGPICTRPASPYDNLQPNTTHTNPNQPIEDLIHDETHGLIAPPSEFQPHHDNQDEDNRPNIAQLLLDKLKQAQTQHAQTQQAQTQPEPQQTELNHPEPQPESKPQPTTLPTLQATAEEPTTKPLTEPPPIQLPPACPELVEGSGLSDAVLTNHPPQKATSHTRKPSA